MKPLPPRCAPWRSRRISHPSRCRRNGDPTGGLGPLRREWSRLRSAWSRNDGKPREERGPKFDLKEAALIVLLVVVVTAMAVMVGLQV